MKLGTVSTIIALTALSTINQPLSISFAQGSLTPPAGAPAPVMKSLDQIEARTPISSAPFTISQPGAYYLTTNLTSSYNAIVIASSDVTVDLGGWTIFSSATNALYGGVAIVLNGGVSDVSILNGFIKSGVTNNGSGVFSGPGFSQGIGANSSVDNARISGVSVSGVLYSGISVFRFNSSVVESCTVRRCGGYGITASTIINSLAVGCAGAGIYGDQVSNCRGVSSGDGDGINAAVIQNSYGESSTGVGVYASVAATNTRGLSTSGVGLYGATATSCTGRSSTSVGVSAGIASFCIGESTSGTGLSAGTATSCRGWSTSGTDLSVTHNLNSF